MTHGRGKSVAWGFKHSRYRSGEYVPRHLRPDGWWPVQLALNPIVVACVVGGMLYLKFAV